MEDFAAHKSTWVEPISTTYRGHTLYEFPPNNQGLTALLLLNILEGIDLKSMRNDPARYYHTLIEATKIAFADRNRYIADPAFAKVPVKELLSKDYAAKRRALINPDKAIDPPAYGDVKMGSDTTYFTVVDKDRNAVSFINSLFNSFGSGIVAGETGIMLHNRGTGFSLRGRSSEPPRARQAAVPHADPGDGVQGRQAADVVRRDGRRHPGAGARAGPHQPDRSRPEPAAGDRRAARPLHQRPRRDAGGHAAAAGDRRARRSAATSACCRRLASCTAR